MTRRRAVGVRRKGAGWESYLRIHGRLHRRSWPLSTPLPLMQQWRDAQRAIYGPRKAASGTFAADVDRYLRLCAPAPWRRPKLEKWLTAFGARPRHAITADDIRRTLADWAADGYQPSTLILLRAVLSHVWTVLDGRNGVNPVRDVPRPVSPPLVVRSLDYETIDRIFAALRPSASKARLMLLAYVGLRPVQIQRLTPADVDLAKRRIAVSGAKGADSRVLPLTAAGVEAVRLFATTTAWGKFCTSGLRRTFREAALRAGVTDDRMTPYMLRHAYGTELVRAGADAQAVAELLTHNSLRMLRRYTLAAIPGRQLEAVEHFNRRRK